MKIKNLLLILAAFLFGFVSLYSQISTATISFNFYDKPKNQVSPYLFGGFTEYYFAFEPGYPGIYAQEFINRGFDIENKVYGVSTPWQPWILIGTSDAGWETPAGGYNENGQFFQRIIHRSNNGGPGVSQKVIATKNTGYDFYTYIRSDSNVGNARVRITSVDMKQTLFDTLLGKPEREWKKYSIKIPEIKNYNSFLCVIYFEGKGSLDIDEASIMPSDNIRGIRRELYNYYKDWKPTVIRYPGGWFVEYSGYHWEMGIGEIDKRHVHVGCENVRLDFGIDEFVSFCKELGIEPHLTINFTSGTPQEAASLVEYCNGTKDTEYGSKRVMNGHLEPYNVKFWEIGNEVWDRMVEYSHGYLGFYDAMKKVDPSILCIIDGDIWQGKNYLDSLLSVTAEKCDIYGWHWQQFGQTDVKCTDEEIYLSMMCGSYFTEDRIDSVVKWSQKYNLRSGFTQAITELWSDYNSNGYTWVQDTSTRGASLENALWMATQYNSLIRKSSNIIHLTKANAIGVIRNHLDSLTDELTYYPTALYSTLVMMRNHVGTELLDSYVYCGEYYMPIVGRLFGGASVPWIDAVVTRSSDSIFISIVNRHIDSSTSVTFNFPEKILGKNCKIYELYSQNYLDRNTPKEKNNIKIKNLDWVCAQNYILKPHSFNIIALPWKEADTIPIIKPSTINLSPNPFKELIKIKMEDEQFIYKVEIYDINGRLVEEKYFDNLNEVTIKTTTYQSGSYQIKIITNKGTQEIKAVKLN